MLRSEISPMPSERNPPIRQFVEDYRRLRLAEGFASTDPTFARQLPFRDTTGRNPGAWRLRAWHYVVVRAGLALLARLGTNVDRVLDVGAGNGWLARRLAPAHRVTAVDVDASASGLGAIDDPRIARVRAELEALPFGDGHFDVAIVAAALHYAVELPRALGELGRVLRRGGVLVIADSPLYPDALRRDRAWRRTFDHYSRAGAAHLAARYRGLTRAELDGCGLFRFLTLSPGLQSWRAIVAPMIDPILRPQAPRDPPARLPVLFGWKR